MGNHKNINLTTFPKQGDYAGRRVTVLFYYNESETIGGELVRYDIEDPFETIIRLDDGRYIRGVECQFGLEGIKL